MSDPVVAPATEPTAPSGPADQAAFNALSPEDRQAWELTGNWPEPAKVTTTAAEVDEDAEPAATTTSGTETTTVAVTTTAPPEAAKLAAERSSGKVTRQQQINDLIRKSTEADLRAKALEDKLAALEAGKPAPKEPEPAKADAFQPTRPKPTDTEFESYAEFVDALTDWKIEQRDAKAAFESAQTQRATAATAAHEAFTSKALAWFERRDTFTSAHPDKAETLTAFLDTVHAGTPIGDVILESEVGAEIADYLATNQAEAGRIRALAPVAALRALGKLEAKFDSAPLTSASASAGPAAKLVTTAPAPPTTLSARSATPADPAAAAVDRGDFSAFEAEENRRALAVTR